MTNDVAVVGMSGRFPGAASVDAFWENVRNGVESITRFSAEELAADGVDPALLHHPRFVNAGGALDGIELFDAGLFGYNPREAEILDPQHRVFLECAWESLEDAGCDPSRYAGLIGVYAGTGPSTYQARLHADPQLAALLGGTQLSIANEKDHLTTRVAYKLDLRGPAVTVQTTCSSSLVAVVLACQSLLTEQCDAALAGGVSIVVPQRTGYVYSEGGILSPDGHCRAFDARARGAVGGNGCGIVVLKRLDDALADGDHVRAVIAGAAINNDGSGKVGYTAPSIDGQAKVIARAHAMAGTSPDDIGYVEAHGTGTPLGDPIEVAALTQAFRTGTDRRGYCALGSVKTNVGHLDAAAGVAGLIKTVLAVERAEIPPSLHYHEPNPALELADSPFYVNDELRTWPPTRRAGVSSFGIGGTNAHVVVEQAPPPVPAAPGRAQQLLVLSARSPEALDAQTANLAAHLEQHRELDLADVAHTLQSGRVALAHRRALVASDCARAAAALRGPLPTGAATGSAPPVAFLLPGQGAQHVGMAGGLYAAEPLFRDAVDHAAELLRQPLGLDLRELVSGAAEHDVARATELLRQTAVAQPALFAVEYALARLWMRWGVTPVALLGHSVGEYVAACLSGVLSFEDALLLVAERGRLMQEQPPGAMLAIALGEDAVRPMLGDALSLAAINGPALCVVSGPEDAVRGLERALAMRGLPGSRLHTSHAFHSATMDAVVEPLAARVRAVARGAPRIPWVSNLHGGWIDAGEAADPAYWAAHLRSCVRFADGLETLLEDPDLVLLEVGPGQTLTRLARSHPAATGRAPIAGLPHATDRADDAEHVVGALGRLFLAGVTVDWSAFQAAAPRRRVPLPRYPFERRRYWIDARPREAEAVASQPVGKAGTPDEWVWVPTWRRTTARTPGAGGGPWLLFDDGGALGTQVASMLAARGDAIVRVGAGARYARRAAGDVELDPGDRAGYGELVRALRADGLMPARVVHLWGLRGSGRASFYSLLFLAQALVESGHAEPLEIAVVTSGAYDVTGDEPLRPEAALALGPCKVIPQEHPQIRCRSVDFTRSADAASLVAELIGDDADRVVAYRGGHRWVQGFERLAPTAVAPQPGLLRDGATVLVTGGLGAVGLALAEVLARTSRPNLVLVGRSAVPKRDAWEAWVGAHGDGDAVSRKIRGMRRLERLGSIVVAESADVSDPQQLAAVVERARARFGAVHGIVHAAGATEADAFGAIAQTTTAACERHFAPKVDALDVLDAAFAGDELDFRVLVSSLSSLLGGLGFVAYASANAYMDAFAVARARGGARWTSVGWDGWDFGGEPAGRRLALTRDEGMLVFERLLAASPQAHVAVSTGDLEDRIAQWVRLDSVRRQPPPAALHERPRLQSAYEAPGDDVERFVAEVWQALLGIERIGLHDNFFELGGHSLLAVQAASRLRDAFRVDVSVHALFEAPTVAGLAAAISATFAAGTLDDDLADVLDQVERLSDEEIAALLDEA